MSIIEHNSQGDPAVQKPISFPRLISVASSSTDPLVADFHDELVRILDLADWLSDKVDQWAFLPGDEVQNQLSRFGHDSEKMNHVYWTDAARTATAYVTTSVWRVTDLVLATAQLADEDKWLSSAVTARSLLEVSANLINAISRFKTSVEEELPSPGSGLKVVGSLKDDLEQAFVGSKIREHQRLGAPEPAKLCATIKRVGEACGQDCFSVYQLLCDYAHPNLLGTAFYWGEESASTSGDGWMIRSVGRSMETDRHRRLRFTVLWTLGWSCEKTRAAFKMVTECGEILKKRFPEVEQVRDRESSFSRDLPDRLM